LAGAKNPAALKEQEAVSTMANPKRVAKAPEGPANLEMNPTASLKVAVRIVPVSQARPWLIRRTAVTQRAVPMARVAKGKPQEKVEPRAPRGKAVRVAAMVLANRDKHPEGRADNRRWQWARDNKVIRLAVLPRMVRGKVVPRPQCHRPILGKNKKVLTA
jgi:hypothetical protein